FQYETVSVRDFIHQVYQKHKPDFSQKAIRFELGRLETAAMGREASIRIDRFQVMRVLQNFIDNAVKFSKDEINTITLHAWIRERPEGNGGEYELRVEVADRGVGIHPEQLPRVFHRFYKGTHGSRVGSGLG